MRGAPRFLFTSFALILATVIYLSFFLSYESPKLSLFAGDGGHGLHWLSNPERVPEQVVMGSSIMANMGNQTKREELGRSSWHVLHTIAARFPVKPSIEEQEATKAFLHLFSRLYPCGDCGRHFKAMLMEFPPQVETRDSLVDWMCERHNDVNARLGKPMFDCKDAAARWECGCAEEEQEKMEKAAQEENKNREEKENEKQGGEKDGKGTADAAPQIKDSKHSKHSKDSKDSNGSMDSNGGKR